MGLNYSYVLWNKDKKRYDKWIAALVLSYLLFFSVFTAWIYPELSAESILIRAFGSMALLLLHFVLIIGPLCRLNPSYLPLLYNRRHLGVTMFLVALVHGVLAIFQFHALGDINPIWAIFTSNPAYDSFLQFPFQTLGFFALLILLVMASTSHDFFLNNLGARVWKSIHMLVYLAYALILVHVILGAFQQERTSFTTLWMTFGFVLLVVTHLAAAIKERKKNLSAAIGDPWINLGDPLEIAANRALSVDYKGSRIAVFRYDNKVSAVHGTCKHQGGPLGEGKIIDGCITCPWHGYQYLPGNGQSPPPFSEKLATYELKLVKGILFLNPEALAEGTSVKPIEIPARQ
jgi:sulfoxide reductase heme-binding subunit YedZ